APSSKPPIAEGTRRQRRILRVPAPCLRSARVPKRSPRLAPPPPRRDATHGDPGRLLCRLPQPGAGGPFSAREPTPRGTRPNVGADDERAHVPRWTATRRSRLLPTRLRARPARKHAEAAVGPRSAQPRRLARIAGRHQATYRGAERSCPRYGRPDSVSRSA